MTPASKNRLFSALFSRHVERRIARSFHDVRMCGLDQLRSACERHPVLIVSNHTAWWDPLVALLLCERLLRVDAYAMMEQRNLEKFPFFSLVGAFGVETDDPRDGARSIRYAAKLLSKAQRVVWIFPQGREVPITAPSLAFRRGAAEVARVASSAKVIPIAIRYEMGATELPTLWVSIGAAMDASRDVHAMHARLVQGVETELERIDRAIVHHDDALFQTVNRGGKHVLFSWAQASLAWLTRRAVAPLRLLEMKGSVPGRSRE